MCNMLPLSGCKSHPSPSCLIWIYDGYLNILFGEITLSMCSSSGHIISAFDWHIAGFYFFNPSATLCLLIGEFNPFIFRVIIDIGGLDTAISSFIFWLLYTSIVSFSLYFCLPFQFGEFLWCSSWVFSLFMICDSAVIFCFVITMRFV